MSLGEQERAILDVESRVWKYAGAKEDHVRRTLGLMPIAYYQRVNALVDRPEAVEYAPQAVSRLRAVRERQRMRRPA